MSGKPTYVRICFRPLTLLRPLYLGSIFSVESNTLASTLAYPTIYTAAGAAISILSSLTGKPYSDFPEAIKTGKLRIYGVYALEDPESKTILLPYSAAEPPTASKPVIEGWASGTRLYPVLKPARRRPDTIYFAKLKRTKGGWRILDITPYRHVAEQRIGIALDHNKKRVTGDRALYTYTTLHGLDRGKTIENLLYCIEIADEKGLLENIPKTQQHGIINFGGRSSLAEYTLTTFDREPPFTASVEEIGNQRLAASHVAVKKQGEKLLTARGETATLVCGSIETVSGWDYAAEAQKKPIPGITQGSLYLVEDTADWGNTGKWYHNLLRSSIPIK